MSLVSFRVRLAASLGLAGLGCTSNPPTIVSAPTSSAPLVQDAALPGPPAKYVDLPTPTKCKGHEVESKSCVDGLTDIPESRYPNPYAACRVAPNFSVTATDAERNGATDTAKDNKCCYINCRGIMRGRPFRADDGLEHIATSSPRGDFRANLTGISLANDVGRAAHWQEAALAEHASVAAFSLLSLQLLSLGAPPALLTLTHQAALDEIRHAEIAFALASGYGGATIGPSALKVKNIAYPTLAELAYEALVDGCVGEAASAVLLLEDAATEPDPKIAALVRDIVADEERHVALAWQIVRWTLSVDASILPSLESALARVAERADVHGQIAREVATPILTALARECAFPA